MFGFRDRTWREVIKLAPHYLALFREPDDNEVWVKDKPISDLPWEYVTKVSASGTHRFDIPVDFRFFAPHPSGINLTWSVDLEKPEANGKSVLDFDTEQLADLMELLPYRAKAQFRQLLLAAALRANEQVGEYIERTSAQLAMIRAVIAIL